MQLLNLPVEHLVTLFSDGRSVVVVGDDQLVSKLLQGIDLLLLQEIRTVEESDPGVK